jgi:hypothetical protein
MPGLRGFAQVAQTGSVLSLIEAACPRGSAAQQSAREESTIQPPEPWPATVPEPHAPAETPVSTGAAAQDAAPRAIRTGAVSRPARPVTVLSLYESDRLNRLWSWIGLGPRRPAHVALRALVLPLVTWLPTAILALAGTPPAFTYRMDASNFFADFAAYAQFWLGLPLFVLAEAIASVTTRSASLEFATSGVIRQHDLPRLEALHRRFNGVQRRAWSDGLCVLLAYALSLATVWPEFEHGPLHGTWHTFTPAQDTWHVLTCHGTRCLTPAGQWEFFFALPLLNYWWLRHVWKVLLWWLYLRALSRFRLDLVATHPDYTGGIGFISTVQGHFAWLILAYGVTNVAATVGYKLALEGAGFSEPPVWGPILGFAVGAPLLFLLPLFMFTRQLYRTKRSARRLYRQRVMEQARVFEAELLPRSAAESTTMSGALDLSVMAQFSRLFEISTHMRVVPFDWRSVSQLIGSTFGAIAMILPALHLQGPLSALLAILQKIALSLGQPAR